MLPQPCPPSSSAPLPPVGGLGGDREEGQRSWGWGGWGKGFFLKKKIKVINNMQRGRPRQQTPPGPSPRPGPQDGGEGPKPMSLTLRPTPQIKPSQVSMSHRTPPPINSCKYVQIMPVTFGYLPPTLHASLNLDLSPHNSTSAISAGGLHATRLREGALWEGVGTPSGWGWPLSHRRVS